MKYDRKSTAHRLIIVAGQTDGLAKNGREKQNNRRISNNLFFIQ